jgi:hypothetical protein
MLLQETNPELPLRVSFPELGDRQGRHPHGTGRGAPPGVAADHADPQTQEAGEQGVAAGLGFQSPGGSGRERSAVLGHPAGQLNPGTGGQVASNAREPVEGDGGIGPAAQALATPRVPRHPAVLLSDRSGGDRHLADRGSTRKRKARQRHPQKTRKRQRPGQSRPVPHGLEAGHWRGQDHRDGDADLLADDQRSPSTRQ